MMGGLRTSANAGDAPTGPERTLCLPEPVRTTSVSPTDASVPIRERRG